MAITLDRAKNLQRGEILVYTGPGAAHRSRPERWRVNGKPQTWKRSPYKIRVPIKHGLYNFYELNENNLQNYTLESEMEQ